MKRHQLFFVWFFLASALVSLQGYTCGGPGGGPGECLYEGKTYKEGDSFSSVDGCNTCGCSLGAVRCTLRACQNKDSCTHNGKTYKNGESFPAGDSCNSCTCQKGSVACTLIACNPGSCTYEGKTYKEGESFPSSDGCNTCSCSGGSVVCTKKACQVACGSRGLPPCAADQFCSFAEGECGAADKPGVCAKKPEACTQQYDPVCGCDGKTHGNACSAASAGVSISYKGECKASPTQCNYNGKIYKDGESFPADDGCNKCHCTAGSVSCTEMACGNACGGLAGLTCGKGEFCNYNADCGFADQTGVCKPIPQGCTDDYTPVCGCDDITYSNACNANAAGVSVKAQGECKPAPGSCTYDGKTYKEGESFPASDGCNTCTCSNGNVGCTKRACQACGSRGLPACAKGQFCNQPSHCGATDIPGSCIEFPQNCTRQYDPVCGCDNKTYGNECNAHSAGVSVQYKGECKSAGSCTYDGKTYKDGESFPATDGCNTCTCKGGMVGCTKIGCATMCGGIAGLPCPSGQYCEYTIGTCNISDRAGTCKPAPAPGSACPAVYDPVCSCAGKTYGNSCEAALAGASIDYKGECKATGLSCTHNGKTYKDGESFPAGDGCNTCTCSNGAVRCTLMPCQKTCGGIAGLPCAKGEYCDYAPGTCNVADRAGVCKALPPPGTACPALYDPYCGCDKKTYSNLCEASLVGASIDYKGPCVSSGGCFYNGKTYTSGDSFPASDGCNTCTCNNGVVGCTKIACRSCGSRGLPPCNAGEFCNFFNNLCGSNDSPGVCKALPSVCNRLYDPVCGCDNKTYGNECNAHAAGVSVKSKGACPAPTCTHNGQIYKDGDSFPAGDGCNTCTCKGGVVSCTKIACPVQCTSIQPTTVCAANEFCNYAEGTCFSRTRVGVCEVVPNACTTLYKPVCGCDGKTYSNACHAASVKMTVDYQGACKPIPPPPPAP